MIYGTNYLKGGVSMIFTLSIGNSIINMGCFEDDCNKFTASISTNKNLTAFEYANSINQILSLYNVDKKYVTGGIINSVVPVLTNVLKEALALLFNCKILTLSAGVKTGLNIKYKQSNELGSDFVCNAVTATNYYNTPCVIFSFGSATTACVINKQGELLGTSIMAGLQMNLDALSKSTAQLRQIAIDTPKEIIGTTTKDAMISGLVYGMASMMDGMIKKYQNLFDEKLNVIVTGRYAKYILPYCDSEYLFDELLTLKGLNLIYKKNIKHK